MNPWVVFLTIAMFVIIRPHMALPAPADPPSSIRLLLTSNLNGRFTITSKNQDREDPMLMMAQSMRHEQAKKPVDLYIDMGNAFYPGLLSRFSYGSIMMDFLDYFKCTGTLVSSRDVNIGIHNLEFLRQNKKVRLLSANIEKDGVPVFDPFFLETLNGKTIAFLALSSEKGFFDIAEKRLLEIKLSPHKTVLKKYMEKIRALNPDYIVLLSGKPYEANMAIMKQHPEISLCITGGDSTGDLYTARAKRVDLDDGRSILSLTDPNGFYTLSLSPMSALSVEGFAFTPMTHIPTDTKPYREFANRLSIWKERYATEGKNHIVQDGLETIEISGSRVATLLRHRFNAEVAILDTAAIMDETIQEGVKYSDLIRIVGNDFPIFTYNLSGKDLKKILTHQDHFIISGIDHGLVQKYPLIDSKSYRTCSPQSVYDYLVRRLGQPIPYTNTWHTLIDEIEADLKGDRVLGYSAYTYLGDRYRMMVDVSLSNFYDNSDVSKSVSMETPPGKPETTYEKWGLENKIDVTLYNQKHKFVITPYIYFVRQDDYYAQNLLRGTVFYTYNLFPVMKPYHKSQIDTVAKVVHGWRPLLVRETFGAFFETSAINGKIGLGFEKQIRDPQEELFAGIETIVGVRKNFLTHVRYAFDLDTFYSTFSNHQFRGEITNALSFKLNSFMAFSIKHKWFYVNNMADRLRYKDNQLLMSLDLETDFKTF